MKVVLEKKAAKYLERLHEPMKSKIIAALQKLAKEPPQGDIKKLQSQETAYRLKIGDYRILYKDKITFYYIPQTLPYTHAVL